MITIRQLAGCTGAHSVVSVRALAPSLPTSVLAILPSIMQPTIDLAFVTVGAHDHAGMIKELMLPALGWKLAQFDLAIGSVLSLALLDPAAEPYADIDSGDEAAALADEWELSGKHIDVFFVETYAGPTLGSTPRRCG